MKDAYLSEDLEDRWEDIEGHPHWITSEQTLRIIGRHIPVTEGAPVCDSYAVLQLLSPNGWQPLHQIQFGKFGEQIIDPDKCVTRLKRYAERLFLRS